MLNSIHSTMTTVRQHGDLNSAELMSDQERPHMAFPTPAQRIARKNLLLVVLGLLSATLAYQAIARFQVNAEVLAQARRAADIEQMFSHRANNEQRKRALVDLFARGGASIRVLQLTYDETHREAPLRQYEADVKFLNDCQLQEGRSAYWSPEYYPGGEPLGPQYRQRGEPRVTQFRQGDVKTIRGIIYLVGALGLSMNAISPGP